jgi:7,8-dihydropterin-6-yl-methyl-4-(beta-D-ribofuranosyl)aminobenzene 5'-phosphate synthase
VQRQIPGKQEQKVVYHQANSLKRRAAAKLRTAILRKIGHIDMRIRTVLAIITALVALFSAHLAGKEDTPSKVEASPHNQLSSVKVTILSTMLADQGIGEWGFSALVEAGDHRVLVDTGARPQTVLQNARELGIELSSVQEVVLTHNHDDHTGGLMTLRQELMKKNPAALSRAHVAKGIFYSRPAKSGGEDNIMIAVKKSYEAAGGTFIEHETSAEIFPGAWLTGPVTRVYPERNWSVSGQVRTPAGLVEDNIPEDQSLVLTTAQGLIVISGCGHAGVVNILTFGRNEFPNVPVYAVVGGLHLFSASDKQISWTADKLKPFQISYLLGAHCTGIESVYQLRQQLGLSRKSAVVGAIGATFVLSEGIHPGRIAQ